MSDARPGSIERVLDANANRAREGLRLVEDYARFVLADEPLAAAARSIRHAISETVGRCAPATSLLAERDTPGDLGADPDTFKAMDRSSLSDVVASALKRAQEALRVLAEFAKTVAPEVAADFERLRYRAYDLEKVALLSAPVDARLRRVRLGVLLGRPSTDEGLKQVVRDVLDAGAGMVVLSVAGTCDRLALSVAQDIRAASSDLEALLVIATRADIARAARADGLLLGAEDIRIAAARGVVGPACRIGVCVEGATEPFGAVAAEADFAVVRDVTAGLPDSTPCFVGPVRPEADVGATTRAQGILLDLRASSPEDARRHVAEARGRLAGA